MFEIKSLKRDSKSSSRISSRFNRKAAPLKDLLINLVNFSSLSESLITGITCSLLHLSYKVKNSLSVNSCSYSGEMSKINLRLLQKLCTPAKFPLPITSGVSSKSGRMFFLHHPVKNKEHLSLLVYILKLAHTT